jgi:hypothetical protein
MKQYIEYRLKDGTQIILQSNNDDSSGVERAAAKRGDVVTKANQTWDAALERIKPAAEGILARLHSLSTRPEVVEVEFSLIATAELGMVVASGSVEANYTVRLKWTHVPGDYE